ncbi:MULTISPECIES: PhoD-like phosphatase [unclassified Coleofasciculus]|uniref:PhoD-like phosphatase n=1 Tax=unclassified Coleofasciculus TaxID=2692782 RepID=UPI00187FE328|nr:MULTISPECIES: PhoD-like phosphatase [unclassified Coleofasciculus]MBE9129448.1 PhoD-like phosphatase [Coleofasciculus sp. LEGE 07081]MBE9149654.1 PhoD-like phosphatase [Coleofasciculus sp. LEGE 07092]
MPPIDAYSEFPQRFEHLPLILAGPILRRTDPDAVTVWVALKAARSVRLSVYSTVNGQGRHIDRKQMEGSRTTVQVGKHLHIVAVTATLSDRSPLEPAQIYAYDLDFGNGDETLNDALNSRGFFPFVTLSYLEHNLPTFAMPPDDLNHLRIIHGSCRKPHGMGRDALPLIDRLIEQFADQPNTRPHQLFLTGDQIYSDDVADPLLGALCDVGTTLLGWEEALPYKQEPAGNYQYQKISDWKPGQRTDIARYYAGLTAMLDDQPQRAKSHLFGFSEYCAMYLFSWSPVLLPPRFPKGTTIRKDPKQASLWDEEAQAIRGFASELWHVRRGMANVPTYTICDDHDISDDWYLNREWCNRVLGKPLGRRIVQNGLLAYALFQGWGNTPEQFTEGQPGEKLLQALQQWSVSGGTDESAWDEMGKYLGLPPMEAKTGLPKLKQDGEVLILDRDYSDGTSALNWHYSVRSFKHEVLVLDTRTWRGYPVGEEGAIAPPMLLSPTAFEQQIQNPLELTDRLNQAGTSSIEATLVVLPTNLVSLSFVDIAQRWDWQQGKVFDHDVGDSWNFHEVAFTQLLETLCQRRDRIVILTGDIHYGCAVRLNYWFHTRNSATQPNSTYSYRASVLVQLTSSSFKNSELKTYVAHTKAKSLVLEQPEYWAGWQHPPQLVEIVTTPSQVRVIDVEVPDSRPFWQQIHSLRGNWDVAWQIALKDERSLPDWRYRIEWIKREKSQPVPGIKRRLELESPQEQSAKWRRVLADSLLRLWRNRWWQEGEEIVGRNNFSVVRFQWSPHDNAKAVIQEIYWHPPWRPTHVVKSRYFVPLQLDSPPPLPKILSSK